MKSTAIFSGSEIGKYPWRPGKKVWSFVIFGGANIDFRKAEFEDKVTNVVAFSLFGGHKIIVPQNVLVTLSGLSLFGSKNLKRSEAKNISTKTDTALHVNAISIFGNAVGQVMFYGRGAGELPTASAVVADVVEIALRFDLKESEGVVYQR